MERNRNNSGHLPVILYPRKSRRRRVGQFDLRRRRFEAQRIGAYLYNRRSLSKSNPIKIKSAFAEECLLCTFEAKIFKVVDSLGIHQFDIVIDRASVMFAEVALGCDVVVLGRPTNESPLR